MQKSVILLAKSYKVGNWCVAGIDTITGQWVRLVSNEESIQHAVREQDLKYEDGSSAAVLDIVQIECKSHVPILGQAENCLIDTDYFLKKDGVATLEDVVNIHPPEQESLLFYNTHESVTDDEINEIPTSKHKSLMLIRPENLSFDVQQWERKKMKANFDYMGTRYTNISVTDPAFLKKLQELSVGNHKAKHQYLFVVSLGEIYELKNCRYKLVASVFKL